MQLPLCSAHQHLCIFKTHRSHVHQPSPNNPAVTPPPDWTNSFRQVHSIFHNSRILLRSPMATSPKATVAAHKTTRRPIPIPAASTPSALSVSPAVSAACHPSPAASLTAAFQDLIFHPSGFSNLIQPIPARPNWDTQQTETGKRPDARFPTISGHFKGDYQCVYLLNQ